MLYPPWSQNTVRKFNPKDNLYSSVYLCFKVRGRPGSPKGQRGFVLSALDPDICTNIMSDKLKGGGTTMELDMDMPATVVLMCTDSPM